MSDVLSPEALCDSPLADLFRLDGEVAVITGGARGLGRAIAERFAEAGAAVVIADINDEAGENAASELRNGAHQAATYCRCDVLNEGEIHRLVESVHESHGPISILVNNAGIYPYSLALDLSTEEWDQVLAVDLRGPFVLSREVGRQMVATKVRGSILNVSSLNAFRSPIPGVAHYDSAKAGLLAMTRSMAVELGPHGIRVNAIAPGVNLTEGQREAFGMNPDGDVDGYPGYIKRWIERTPLRRHGLPDDQARVAAFLVSPAAAFVTGHCLVVDGGAALV